MSRWEPVLGHPRRGRARQLVDELPVAGHLEGGQPCGGVRVQLGQVMPAARRALSRSKPGSAGTSFATGLPRRVMTIPSPYSTCSSSWPNRSGASAIAIAFTEKSRRRRSSRSPAGDTSGSAPARGYRSRRVEATSTRPSRAPSAPPPAGARPGPGGQPGEPVPRRLGPGAGPRQRAPGPGVRHGSVPKLVPRFSNATSRTRLRHPEPPP